MTLLDMKQQQKEALGKAEGIIRAAEQAGRGLTANESTDYETSMKTFKELGLAARGREELTTIKAAFGGVHGLLGVGTPSGTFNARPSADFSPVQSAVSRNPVYSEALSAYLRSGGKYASPDLAAGADGVGGFVMPGSESYTRQRSANGYGSMSAVSYEGTQGSSGASGGFAISVPTVQQITPLGMPDLGIFDAATVIPTSTDVRIPLQVSFGTSAIKAESNGTLATFGGTDSTLGQTLLSAYVVGGLRWVSFELLQDVDSFQSFVADDLLKGQRIFEGSLLASGNSTTQPQGIFGATGTGTGSAYALAGTSADAATIINALYDVTATLKATYQPNASWIMSRATALAVRKAQTQANLFVPVITTGADGTLNILDRPVHFDLNAPALPTATTAGVLPILYGDFKAAYMVGVRGGAGINVKILDQPQAAQGLVGILAYRRIDGRIRISEAAQQIKFSHS